MAKKKYPKNWIKELRKAKGITAKDLGAAVGTTGPYITMLENGERRLYNDWVLKIAHVLRCHPTEIVTGKQTDLIASDDREQELLRTFRGLPEGEKEMLSRMLDSFAKDKKPTDDDGHVETTPKRNKK